MSKCSDKLNEMGKVEKATWLRLDQIQENCDNMKQQVEAKVETRVSSLSMCMIVLKKAARVKFTYKFACVTEKQE